MFEVGGCIWALPIQACVPRQLLEVLIQPPKLFECDISSFVGVQTGPESLVLPGMYMPIVAGLGCAQCRLWRLLVGTFSHSINTSMTSLMLDSDCGVGHCPAGSCLLQCTVCAAQGYRSLEGHIIVAGYEY